MDTRTIGKSPRGDRRRPSPPRSGDAITRLGDRPELCCFFKSRAAGLRRRQDLPVLEVHACSKTGS